VIVSSARAPAMPGQWALAAFTGRESAGRRGVPEGDPSRRVPLGTTSSSVASAARPYVNRLSPECWGDIFGQKVDAALLEARNGGQDAAS
jgi:hypothetical protein